MAKVLPSLHTEAVKSWVDTVAKFTRTVVIERSFLCRWSWEKSDEKLLSLGSLIDMQAFASALTLLLKLYSQQYHLRTINFFSVIK